MAELQQFCNDTQLNSGKPMPSELPFVSIIIPTYKEWDKLKQCITALEKQTYLEDRFEVIVVNNCPEETLPENITLPAKYRVLSEAKPGSYAARNTGLKEAKGEIIGFTDSDCIPDNNWIKNAVEYLQKDLLCTRVAGPILIMQKAEKPTIIEKYNHIYAFPQQWLINNGGGSVTANLFVRKHVFDKVGGFDENLLSMGDKQWGMKANAAGFKITYLENVSVQHPPRTLKELIKKEKRHAGALIDGAPKHPVKLYWKLIYESRPRLSGLRYMLGRRKDRSLLERLLIPLLRHYLLFVRRYEVVQICLGKKKPSRV